MSLPIPKADYNRYFAENVTHPVVFPDEDDYVGDGKSPVCKASGKLRRRACWVTSCIVGNLWRQVK